MVLPAMSDHSSDLLTIDDAATLLGVSRATFNRSRERLGLRPVPTARLKPLMFSREAVVAASNGVQIDASAPARTAKTLLARTAILPVPALKAAGKAARKGAGK